MIEVVCVKWGTKFTPQYVNNLYNGIKHNTNINFRFHCYTDSTTDLQDPIITHKLPEGLEGWWNKVYLFSDQLTHDIGADMVYMDLDTVITGNIDHILRYKPKHFAGLENWYRPGQLNSSVMLWQHGNMFKAWNDFAEDPQRAINSTTDGDQEFINRYMTEADYLQTQFPKQLFSYKQSCSKGLPNDTRLVCYHGTPSIEQSYSETVTNYDGVWQPQTWVKQYWRTA